MGVLIASMCFVAGLLEHRVLSVPVPGQVQRRDRGVCVERCPEGFMLDDDMRTCISCGGECVAGEPVYLYVPIHYYWTALS